MSQENVEVVRRAVGPLQDAADEVARTASVERLSPTVVRGSGKGSHAEFDVRAGWIYTVRDSKVVRIRAYYERAEARAAVGLSA